MTRILVPRERRPRETRVAATPETVRRMVKEGLEVHVEAGAGEAAFFPDARYVEAGAQVAPAGSEAWAAADVVLKVGPLQPSEALGGGHEADAPRSGAIVVGMLSPYNQVDAVRTLAARGVTSVAFELLPRVTRAQPMDALSSQASVAGYKAALVAAHRLGRYFPLLMTAAGTLPPARVVVAGGGVAGLQALATAKRLGAVVEVSDIRPEVKEQVESLGGRFIDLPAAEAGEQVSGGGGYARQVSQRFLERQREIVAARVAAADVVITAAFVPGKRAPLLVSAAMVEAMRPGAVVVDLAVEQGGNCELSRADEEVVHHGVLVLGTSNMAATMPTDASAVYARNALALLLHLWREHRLRIEPADEIVGPMLVTHGGEVVSPVIAALAGIPATAS
jgi:NAD(P) transhydrogenase subunit alpha